MPNRVQWDPCFSVADETIDTQHKNLLALCNTLADHCGTEDGAEDSADQNRKFQQAYADMMALARAHFAAEEALLAGSGDADLEDYRFECEEFEFLVDEIVTTENFDKIELQRFLALWWSGHILGIARRWAQSAKN